MRILRQLVNNQKPLNQTSQNVTPNQASIRTFTRISFLPFLLLLPQLTDQLRVLMAAVKPPAVSLFVSL